MEPSQRSTRHPAPGGGPASGARQEETGSARHLQPAGTDASAPEAQNFSDLVRLARSGDPDAQEAIVRSFENRVLRLARNMMGNLADAEDAAQEAFLRIFRRLDRLDPGRDPSGWVVRVTVHVCCDHLSRRRRLSEGPLVGEDWASGEPGPFVTAEQAQQRQILRRSLGILAPRERAVFVLHEIEGEEVRAIARALRISRITVRRHLSRARSHLRSYLAQKYPQLL